MEEGYNREDKYAEKTHERIVVDGSYSFEGRLSQYKDSLRKDYDDLRKELEAVSYTHLTLPTTLTV